MSIGRKLLPALAVLGPGLLVMLADTDAGSLILSAQSGAVWGYKLLLAQVLLIPVLFIAQELAVRLGLATGMGQSELIKKHFGKTFAWIAVIGILICCVGALLTEFSGLVAVGEIFGVSSTKILSLTVVLLILMAWTGSYASIERIAIFLGLFELAFLWIAWRASPDFHEIVHSATSIPWKNADYLYLVAGNIGAVIMPWMIYFQQSAVLDKGLGLHNLRASRIDTFLGAFVTQLIMISMLVVTAATIGKTNPHTPLNTIGEISEAITPVVGYHMGRILFALGMAGASLVATIVVSLTAAWCVGEITGHRRSLEDHPSEAPWFYATYTFILLISAVLIGSHLVNLVKLNVAIEVMNALFLPFVLGCLYLLCKRVLPDTHQLKGWYGVLVGIVLLATAVFGFIAAMWGILFATAV